MTVRGLTSPKSLWSGGQTRCKAAAYGWLAWPSTRSTSVVSAGAGDACTHFRSRRNTGRHRLRARLRVAARAGGGWPGDRWLEDPPAHRDERGPFYPRCRARDWEATERRRRRADPDAARRALP